MPKYKFPSLSINEAKYLHGVLGKGFWTFYGGHDPEDYQHNVGEVSGLITIEMENRLERDTNQEGGGHRADFAPGIDAPPIPAEEEHEAGACAGDDEELPGSGNRVHIEGDDCRDDRDENGGGLRDADEFHAAGLWTPEAAVEVIDQVTCAPVELCGDGGHVSGGEGG